MKHVTPYHTALADGHEEQAEPLDRVEFSDGVALRHDVWDDLPPEFDACDVIYAEPPWPKGYAIFNERAEVQAPPWSEFQKRIAQHALRSLGRGVPTVLMAGNVALRHHPHAGYTREVVLNGNRVLAVCYGTTVESSNAIDLIHELAERFDCIGDYCCGYGRTIGIVREHGKRFVASDHNARCIGFIAEHWRET